MLTECASDAQILRSRPVGAGSHNAVAVRAVVYNVFGEAPSVREVPDPTAPDDGVVVRVEATGLCRSDWHGWRGHDPDIKVPHVPGHELAGTIVEVGRDVAKWKVGDRVIVPFICAC